MLLFVVSGSLLAQQEVIIYPDSAKGKYKPKGLIFGADLIGGTKTIVMEDLDWLNFFAAVEIYRYTINVEYGQEFRRSMDEEGTYETDGSYFRIGPDVNFLFRDPDHSALFLGLRYGFNTFSDKLDYTIDDPVWGTGDATLRNEDLHAKWFELVAGLRVKLFQAVWTGFTGRFKFAGTTFEDNALIPQYTPGYGRADLQSTWEFNYWIMIRLPLYKPAASLRVPSTLPRVD